MPPAMAPALELRPPTGVGVALFDTAVPWAVLDAALFEVELPETEGTGKPGIVPGPNSGEAINVARV